MKKAGAPRYAMSGIHYGLGWWVTGYQYRGKAIQGYFAGGNGGQVVLVIPELDMVVTIFGANYQDAATFIPQREYVPRFILPAVRDSYFRRCAIHTSGGARFILPAVSGERLRQQTVKRLPGTVNRC